MAKIDELLNHISDSVLRERLRVAIAEIRDPRRFGLMFEQHIPETVLLSGATVQKGVLVKRRDIASEDEWYVEAVGKGVAELKHTLTGAATNTPVEDLVVLKRFGDPVYPALTPLDRIEQGGDKPWHAVINGENYHALQLLLYLYEEQVDCLYLDPPYNTGARDWTYNNRFVDKKDSYRHSKWLSMMDRRLGLAKRLLRPRDGVLIVTIDEHEVHHLGMLLEKLFPAPQYLRHMVTIKINPKGTGKYNFARVDEYAFFCVPNVGKTIIAGTPNIFVKPAAPTGSKAQQVSLGLLDVGISAGMVDEEATLELTDDEEEDYLDDESDGDEEFAPIEEDVGDKAVWDKPFSEEEAAMWELRHARRRGSESSYRHQRPNQFYPIWIDEKKKKVLDAGDSWLPLSKAPETKRIKGLLPVWPIDSEGNHRCWRFIPEVMRRLIAERRVILGRFNEERKSWTLNIWERRPATKKLKTIWDRPEYDAGTHGTTLLHKLLGRRDAFPFPKSVYAVRDALAAVVRNRPNALIVDVFAGSGTTLHATAFLNAADNGSRQCILVTNNEVQDKIAKRLNKQGHFTGDPNFEAKGIFEQATRPRVRAAITGKTSAGQKLPGKYIDGRAMSMGFEENVEFFRLDYLDPNEVSLGRQFNAIFPLLWLTAGSHGTRSISGIKQGWILPSGGKFGVLFETDRFQEFKQAVAKRSDISHVWLVTDDEQSFAGMRAHISPAVRVAMLYRQYLRNFMINAERKS